MRVSELKKRYRFEFSSYQYSLLVLALLFIGGLLFTFGLMVGYYQSRTTYEEIMAQAVSEGPGVNREKITVLEVSGRDKPPKKPSPYNITNKPPGKQTLYCVQVGAFKKKNDAYRLQKSLKKRGYDAFVIFSDQGKKGSWHRVRIGQFRKKQSAEKLAKVLLKKEKMEGLVLKQ